MPCPGPRTGPDLESAGLQSPCPESLCLTASCRLTAIHTHSHTLWETLFSTLSIMDNKALQWPQFFKLP